MAAAARVPALRRGGLVISAGIGGLVGLTSAAPIRFATFNASLNRNAPGQLATDLAPPTNTQAKRVAEIIQRIAPDVVLINEFDFDTAGPDGSSLAAQRFHDNYLAVAQGTQSAITFPHRFVAPSNTGVPTGETATARGDFDNNGSVVTTPGSDAYGNDCFGFGWFPGHFGMAVFSKFPIEAAGARTFQKFLWEDLPNPSWPDRAGTPEPVDWFTPEEKGVLRLSSKSHWDLPITVAPGLVIHLLAAHPTPPVFDGAEDRNGRRNHDEIGFWATYLDNAPWIYDDPTSIDDPPRFGGLGPRERFVIAGDHNADPIKGDSFNRAINQILDHPRVNAGFVPSSPGGGTDTADFASGRLRVDYVLPSKAGLAVHGGGVFWPLPSQPGAALLAASDHRLVWIDVDAIPIIEEAVRNLDATVEGGDVRLTWKTQPGIHYEVERSPDLTTWMTAPSIALSLDPSSQSAQATDAGGAVAPWHFYRVVAAFDSQ